MLSRLPEDVSTFGGELDPIFALIYYVAGVGFIATQAYPVYCLVRFRRREGQTSEYHPGTTSRRMAWIPIPCAVALALDLWIDFRGADVWAKVKLSRPTPIRWSA